MLENLIQLIRQQAGDAVINNPAIPNEHNEDVIEEAGNSITGSLQNMLSQANLQAVLHLFPNRSGAVTSNPALQNISGNFIQNLMDKFGISQSAASGVASNLIPSVLQKLVHKTNDPADNSFDLQGILSHLGAGQGIQGILGSLTESGSAAGIMEKVKSLLT